MIKEKACRNCKMIFEKGTKCPNCGSESITTFWRDYVLILDPERSEIAKKLSITVPGKYALKISR